MRSMDVNARRATVVVELKRGWPALIAGFVGVTAGVAAMYFYSIGLFIKPVQAEFGWSRTALSWVPTIASLALALASPVTGFLTDRLGIRPVALFSIFALSGGFFLLGQSQGPLSLFLATVALTVIGGSGTSPVTYSRLINLWFDKARGLALGLILAGTGVAGAFLPRFIGPFIADHGWRDGYHLMAALVLIALPFVGLFGVAPKTQITTEKRNSQDTGLTLAQARVTRTFWVVGFTFFFAAFAVGSIIVHFVPMLRDAGLSPERAGTLAGLIGLAIIFGRIVSGAVIDRIFAPYVATTILALAACGCFALAFGGIPFAPLAAILVGLAMGAEVDLVGYLTARYFGLKQYGTIYGFLYAFFMTGSIIGPIMAGVLVDHFGSYTIALIIFGISLSIAASLSTTLPRFPSLPD